MVFVQLHTILPPRYDVLCPAFVLQMPRYPILPLVKRRRYSIFRVRNPDKHAVYEA